MAALLKDLIVPSTKATIESRLLGMLGLASLPVTSWGPTGPYRRLFAATSDVMADLAFAIAQVSNGMVLGLSTGRWLSLLGASQFDELRKPALFTHGKAVLVDNGGGPHAISSGMVVENETGTLRYRILNSGTLPLHGTFDAELKAEEAGGKYNVPNNTITRIVTSLPTVTVSNPPIGTTGTWITSLGADEEGDLAYTTRLRAKWATLSTGSPAAAYLYWALSQHGATRARVDDGNPDGAGSLRVYLDSAVAVVSFQALVDTKKPVGTKVTGFSTTTQTVNVPGVVTVRKTFRHAAETEIAANLVALGNETEIGGIVRKAELVERVMSPEGVVDFEVGSAWAGTPNLQLGASAIPSIVPNLTYLEI